MNRNSMTIPWQTMTEREFACFRCALGESIIAANGTFWRRVRPFFYRPLLPFQEYPPRSAGGPGLAVFGGFQHAVPPGTRSNSFLNFVSCENPDSYSLGGLDRHERREIKRAAETFTVSLVTNVNEFKAQAYSVYQSFYERTRYGYKAERRHYKKFSKWAEALYLYPKVIVLGAYKTDRRLGAVGVWHLVGETLVYSTFFCDSESLKRHVTGLMLHAMREAAARSNDIRKIHIGSYKFSAAKGIDEYYLARGCTLVQKPAWLQLNPLAAFGLQRFAPLQYSRLIGEIPAAKAGPAITPATPSQKPEYGKIVPPR
jgi:hypothetical protein